MNNDGLFNFFNTDLQGNMKCVQIQDAEQSWAASLDKCKTLGGDLFSLNSPTDLEVSELFKLYPTALGK